MKSIFSKLLGEGSRIILGFSFFISALILERFDFEIFSLLIYIAALLISGGPVFAAAIKGILRRDLLDEKFLMSIASIGAIALGEERGEGVAVMLFFLVGEFFEHKAISRSRKSIKALMDICPDTARVITESGEETVYAEDVELGALISLRAGERIALDSVVVEGGAYLDISALTGEALPIAVAAGDDIKSGAVLLSGSLRAKTVALAENSSAQRILSLVEEANERKAKAENFITSFSKIYTPVVVALALLLAIIPPIFNIINWQESVYRSLTFLVISCPCALVISVPMAFFGGIGCAASRGVLFKGGNVFSSLAKSKCVCFDKTGTLTKGEFNISKLLPFNVTEDYLLSIAAAVEAESNHPIANCIKSASKNSLKATHHSEEAGLGMSAFVSDERALVGSERFLTKNNIRIPKEFLNMGYIYVSLGERFLGAIDISDSLRPEAEKALSDLYNLGIKRFVMLSGDKREKAEKIAKALNISESECELLPEEKYKRLENIINSEKNVVYVGDGINDAPSLALASIGIAMGGIGQDSAIESADVVITADRLDKIPFAVKIARKTVRIAKENIAFAIGVKAAVLFFGAIGIANMWLAVFADVGVAVIAILNSMRALSVREKKHE